MFQATHSANCCRRERLSNSASQHGVGFIMTKADENRDRIRVVTTCHTDVELEDANSNSTEGRAHGGIHYHTHLPFSAA